MTVETVESKDGTPIARWRSGEGPPLVFVHGMGVDHREFDLTVAPWLQPRFSVWAIDRRGRGASGDSPDYALEREFEDVAAVVDAIGGPVDVFGMSYGATVALGALPLVTNLRRAVVYDPRSFLGDTGSSLAGLQPLLREDGEATMTAFFRAVLGDDDPRLDNLRDLVRDPRLPATLPREATALDEWTPDLNLYAAINTPVMFLTGSDSPPVHHRTIDAAHAVLPHSQVTVLDGHGHIALWKSPELVAGCIIEFLQDPAPPRRLGATVTLDRHVGGQPRSRTWRVRRGG